MASLRNQVLSLYKRVLKVGHNWKAKSGKLEESEKERDYIIREAKTLFRQNKNINNPEEIRSLMSDAERRLSIALHYKIPYPRPVNLPPRTNLNIFRRKKEAKI